MNNNRGFIATILIISISSLMLAFIFMQSIEFGHFFDEVKNKEYRLISYYRAYSCIDQAILAIAHDYFFNSLKEIVIPDLNCSILSVLNNGDLFNIKVSGKFNNIIVYRSAIVRLFDNHIEIISIE